MDGKIRLIIDTDSGQDDVIATLMARGLVKRGLTDFMALIAVTGNVGLNHTSANVRIICDWTGRKDFPVYVGAGKPLLCDLVTAEEVHGKAGSDSVALHDSECPLQSIHATDYLIRALRGAEHGSITLYPIGSLTSVALTLSLIPDIADAVKNIVLMGGCYFEAGNITPCAEFSFYADPHVVQIVSQSGASIMILPLGVTHKAQITTSRTDILRRLGNANDPRLTDILQSYEQYDIQAFGLEGGLLHDPCAVAFAVFLELFRGKACRVDVDTQNEPSLGTCSIDWRGTTDKPVNASWITEVDSDGLFRELAESVSSLP